MSFAYRFNELCEREGISLSKLARAVGIPKATLHGWMHGRHSANPDHLKKLASFFRVSVHILLFGERDPFEVTGEDRLEEIFHAEVVVTIHRMERRKRTIK